MNSIQAQQNISEMISQEEDVIQPVFPLPDYPTSATNHCFDIDYVQENCITVFINVNVHFFLDDNCEGNIATAPGETADLNPSNAFEIAEQMIDNANIFFQTMSDNPLGMNHQWNTVEHGATSTSAQCIPFRYVLKGTRIHCNSASQTISNIGKVMNLFENSGSEINIFVGNVPGTANGYSWYNSNYFVTEFVSGDFAAAVFNHEIGHALNLFHSFEDDKCDDTWKYKWTWDNDCDGVVDATDVNCWDANAIYNDMDACDLANFCTTHPCCNASLQNNNLMAYCTWAANPNFAALTPCQITRMLTNLAEFKCNFIQVGGCPPPSAYIGLIPQPANNSICNSCFYLNASYNDSGYEMDILDSNGSKLIATGEINNEAGKFCITPRYDKWGQPYWPYGFQSGVEYTLKLKVFNECGNEDTSEMKFILPTLCTKIIYEPVPDTIKTLVIESISPNPTSNNTTVRYTTKTNGQLKVYGMSMNNSTGYGLLSTTNETISSNNELILDITLWQTGINALIFEFDGELIIENVLKN
ncbi:MAG: hypothetical protein IT263_10510 [Saprospiraceae bacterium]|nr:hypothetical protein [Saprospiraceae bacterium]